MGVVNKQQNLKIVMCMGMAVGGPRTPFASQSYKAERDTHLNKG